MPRCCGKRDHVIDFAAPGPPSPRQVNNPWRSPHGRAIAPAILIAALSASPAAAQVGASVSVSSEEWLRGDPVSNGDPVARLDLTYDDDSGVYVGGSATAVATPRANARLLGFRSYLGIARRTRSGLIIDAGIADTRYSQYASFGHSAGYTEAYVGVANRHFSGRLSYSPGYLQKERSTLYAEIDVVVEPKANWRFSAHVGALTQIGGVKTPGPYRSSFDWRLGAGTRAGKFDLELALTGTGADSSRSGSTEQQRHALILGATYAF